MTGIYFLIRNRKIIYIGQSTDVMRRLREHCQSCWFTKFRVIECDYSRLDEYEKRLIKLFKPPLNTQHNTVRSNHKFRFLGRKGRKLSISKFGKILIKVKKDDKNVMNLCIKDSKFKE